MNCERLVTRQHLIYVDIMYVLAVIQDKLKILPEQFDRDTSEVLIEQIDIKYSNKVLLDVGLCVGFYDFLEVQEAYVYPGEGSCHQVVKFRLIVYRPFVGETLTGRISHSDSQGIRVSMGFFSDILIPARCIKQPSSFNPDKGCWTWHYLTDDASEDFHMTAGDAIRFKVQECVFTLVTASIKERRVTLSTTATSMIAADGSMQTRPRSGGGFFASLAAQSAAVLAGAGGSAADLAGLGVAGVRRPRSSSNVGMGDAARGAAAGEAEEEPAMQVFGDISLDDGLGLTEWWS